VLLMHLLLTNYNVFCFTVKTVIVKGRAPVDPECHTSDSVHVYTEGSDIYDVMLNQVSSLKLTHKSTFLYITKKINVSVFFMLILLM